MLPPCPVERRPDRSWRDTEHANTILRRFLRQGIGHHRHARLTDSASAIARYENALIRQTDIHNQSHSRRARHALMVNGKVGDMFLPMLFANSCSFALYPATESVFAER
jgi:hypothetical protein